MAALAERRIIPIDELQAEAQEQPTAEVLSLPPSENQPQQQSREATQESSQESSQESPQDTSELATSEQDTPEQDTSEQDTSEQDTCEQQSEESSDEQLQAEEPESRPEHLRLLEALLFASAAPLDEKTLGARLPEGVDLRVSLAALQAEYAPRGVNLVRINNKWTFRTASDLSWLLTKEAVVPKKLSRAAMETLAVIAYHQPVTRAEIEDIRGVVISKGTIDVLMETGWIRPRGRRKVPGRPITYGTSEDFLSHFGLETLGDLPGLEELKGSGLLDSRLPPGFAVPMPSDDPTLREDEDPLEPGDLDLGLAPPPERVEE
jgi:segregation and condensation protein B